MPIKVNPNPVGEEEAKHAGKSDLVKVTYMLLAGLGVVVTSIMTPIALHLAAQNRNLAVQEIGQAAVYPTTLSAPQITPSGNDLLISFTKPTTSPMGWSIDSARLKVVHNAGTMSYYINGAWVDLSVPLSDPVSVTVPAASLPGGTLVDNAKYYVTLEVVLTNGEHNKNFAVHSKYNWKYSAP